MNFLVEKSIFKQHDHLLATLHFVTIQNFVTDLWCATKNIKNIVLSIGIVLINTNIIIIVL